MYAIHNSFESYKVLVQVPITTSTSKTELGMEYKRVYKTVGLPSCPRNYDLENLRASYEIRKHKKNLKNVWGHRLVSSFHCRNELLALTSIKHARRDTKSFQSSLTLLDFLIFHKIFCTGIIFCREKQLKTKLVYLKST